jgi:hypothetical protein
MNLWQKAVPGIHGEVYLIFVSYDTAKKIAASISRLLFLFDRNAAA